MKTIIAAMVIAQLITVSTGLTADAEKKELKPQTVCPVMGGKIDKAQYLDHESKRIYICCAGCMGALKKDPAKYIAKMAENGEKPADLQTVCPVMGGKIDKDQYLDHKGKRIYICCGGCMGALKKDPDKYIAKMEKAGITPYSTPASSKKSKKK